jgi:hypothetical protein
VQAGDEILDLDPGARLAGPVIMHVLIDIEILDRLPAGPGQSGEVDNEVEGLGRPSMLFEFVDQAAPEIAAVPDGFLEQHQSGDVFGAAFRFGQEECEVEGRELSHRVFLEMPGLGILAWAAVITKVVRHDACLRVKEQLIWVIMTALHTPAVCLATFQ